MSRTVSSRCRSNRKASPSQRESLYKPDGQIAGRVQAVGPEHFGVVCFDGAKARSKYLLADFYGRRLLEPTVVAHTRGDLQAASERLRQACVEHDLRDVIVVIERTGEYHRPVQRALREAGWETRLVHSYATKQYRQPANPGNKTDDTDLEAIFRLAINGLGLLEPTWPDDYQQLQLLRRHRYDLVCKVTQLACQIREKLHAAMPGLAESFCHLWDTPSVLLLARQTGSAAAVRQAGVEGLARLLTASGIGFRRDTVHKVLAWAEQAAPGHPQSDCLRTVFGDLDDDRREKTRQIRLLEQTLAGYVARTPYVLLLAVPGINIVTSADLAGELGPIGFYANANRITGRAGLMPWRYQSDEVDVRGGLRRGGNRRLRGVLMQIADNLVHHNHHFRARAALWTRAGKDPRWIRVKVAKSFSRFAFLVLTTAQLVPHPCCRDRTYVLQKLLEFHTDHATPPENIQRDLLAASAVIPTQHHAAEAQPLVELQDKLSRRRGPQPLASILPLVLARLGIPVLQSEDVREDLS